MLTSVVATLIGGGIAFVSAYFTLRRTQNFQQWNDRSLSLLPLRQNAIQKVWSALLRARLNEPLSEEERQEVLGLTIWLPSDLRVLCIRALGDRNEIAPALERLTQYVKQIESGKNV
ncbi:hypothetical protein [Streptomyces sp. 184]|uniref:hypothetical protein n=1 Tax=Streptomyces sp. 184 TaxID=1827526 RepID=UPI0038913630